MLILAHPGLPPAPHDVWSAWSIDPWLVLVGGVAWWLHRRGQRSGQPATGWLGAGLLVTALAIASPLDAMASVLVSAHMVQHLLLMMVAAPLLALARPGPTMLLGLPRPVRKSIGRARRRLRLLPATMRRATHPLLVWLAFAGALWFWHLPGPYDAALGSELVHGVGHSTLVASGVLFWSWVLGDADRKRGLAVLVVFAGALQSTVLAVLLTFARIPWYAPRNVEAWSLTPLEDQQLAGVIMWVPGGLLFLAAGLALFASWVRSTTPPGAHLDQARS